MIIMFPRLHLQRIRLMGTAPTFYRRLNDLFFAKKIHDTISRKRLKLEQVHSEPNIYVIDNFLTSADLQYFESKIASVSFEKSFVDNLSRQTGKKRQRLTMLDSSHRTSTFFPFRKLHDVRVSALEQRVADLFGCWVHQIEALQLVRYLPGQFFGLHHDLGDLLEDDQVTLPPKSLFTKRRILTLFCYLNTLENQGGCTFFPLCSKLRVQPKSGRAVLWSNVTREGLPDERTIHSGEPLRTSNDPTAVKYGLNIWICEE